MDLIRSKFNELKNALSCIKDLQVTFKGNAELSLHKKANPECSKFKAEVIEDGATADLTDIILVGTAVVTIASICGLVADLFD